MTSISSARRKQAPAAPLLAVALLWLIFAQATRGAVVSSLAFDEGPHLAVGYAYLRTGDLRLQPVHIHPPLTNMMAAAPLLLDPSLPDPRAIHGWSIASLSAVTDTVVWQRSPPDGLALAGRLPIILMAVLLGAVVYRWAADLAGRSAGGLALLLYALDPNVIAHAQVITTDLGVTAFGFVALYLSFKLRPFRRLWLAGTGAALGAALASKVSAALLAPLLAVIVWQAGSGTILQRIQRVALVGLAAFGVLWAVYGFEVGSLPGLPVSVPAATHVKIYQSLQQHYAEGHPSFLMGMNSTSGWWYYFPVAFLIKTPLPTLIGLLASLAVLAVRRARSKVSRAGPALWLFPVVHFGTALFSSVDIGYRHLLPILPFVFVFLGVQMVDLCHANAARVSRQAFHFGRALGLVLLAWYVAGAALIFPHHLAYFNELAGGPANGYRWLVDSNLDWGQNLQELAAYVEAHGISNIFVSQFSPSRPEVYGVPATMVLPSPRAGAWARFDPAPGWYAIGATTLQGVYTPDVDTFAYFRALTPTARLGYALFVYRVPEAPGGQWVAQCANPAPPLDDGEIQAGFGRADMRRVQFDCSSSWWYPASSSPGWYVEARGPNLDVRTWYASARVIYTPRDEQAGFSQVYRVDSPGLPAEGRQKQARAADSDWLPAQAMAEGAPVTAPVTTTGPLRFEGFWLNDDRPPNRPGGQVMVYTAWRVTSGASAPVSIMAHLIDAQGRLVSGSDGLGVPIETWQVGDGIVQAHRLDLPAGLAPGTYWVETGLYRLDTLERYRFMDGDKVVGDRLLLAAPDVSKRVGFP